MSQSRFQQQPLQQQQGSITSIPIGGNQQQSQGVGSSGLGGQQGGQSATQIPIGQQQSSSNQPRSSWEFMNQKPIPPPVTSAEAMEDARERQTHRDATGPIGKFFPRTKSVSSAVSGQAILGTRDGLFMAAEGGYGPKFIEGTTHVMGPYARPATDLADTQQQSVRPFAQQAPIPYNVPIVGQAPIVARNQQGGNRGGQQQFQQQRYGDDDDTGRYDRFRDQYDQPNRGYRDDDYERGGWGRQQPYRGQDEFQPRRYGDRDQDQQQQQQRYRQQPYRDQDELQSRRYGDRDYDQQQRYRTDERYGQRGNDDRQQQQQRFQSQSEPDIDYASGRYGYGGGQQQNRPLNFRQQSLQQQLESQGFGYNR
jgi:hypothetical protein